MKEQDDDHDYEKDIKQKASQLALCFVALIAAVLVCLGSLAWFATRSNVTATGLEVELGGSSLKVAKESGGADISSLVDNKLTISPVISSRIMPGEVGSFSVFATLGKDGTANLRLSVEPYDNGDGEIFRTQDTVKQERAITYLQTHIAFFTNYDESTHIYSGWINNDTGITLTLGENEKEIKIYWMWIESYSSINTSLISSVDVNRITEHVNANPIKYFESHKSLTNEQLMSITELQKVTYYNYADEYIGNVIEYISYKMSFSNF